MAGFEGVALSIILITSILSAVFSILIWRSNITRDIIQQEREITHSIGSDEHIITSPEFETSIPDKITLNVRDVRCFPGSDANSRIVNLIFEERGETAIEFSVYAEDGQPLEREVYEDALERVNDTFEGSEPKMWVTSKKVNESNLHIYDSKPKAVISSFNGFLGEFKYEIHGSYREFRAIEDTRNTEQG